ncbi:UDP-forming cellulose synthase catalytic subunit [Belnapia sp. T6]|uniref:Cellulose synthase catalytic subunit [UDP-forming] n=1 Tax=Belnapia mucosa TaxID=2804532 RepID=A0ABS1V2P2_9PROT|nr:UDP-forming cellulose synthase catalytic subunit [Belnapia mucosa]MBL6454954.1 UDP-forming cellulose synthase catalytic subunit [Belnapia mucosa]
MSGAAHSRERLARLPLMRSRVGGAVATVMGLMAALVVIVAPLQPEDQAYLAIGGLVLFLVANVFRGRTVTIALSALSAIVSLRYIYWRLNDTLDYNGFWQTFLGTGLLLAEIYAVAALVLSYFQSVWPLDRKPVPLPEDVDLWPVVDVFIPTFNEPLEVVKPTIFAALALDWPPEKLRVHVLDDGQREEFRRFAAEAGAAYITRPDNKGAKAGNINHALEETDGEYVVVFDCDHVPTRAFLQLTVGWMLRDRDLCMVQTPHHFYSPDPFERNLVTGNRVPNENLLFYGLIQQGNDFWGGTFFCGSCAVIRRTALEEIGGVPTETVTEDCHASLRMQRLGWRTAYLRIPLAAGLATERLMLHIGQRMRWGRGMIQILRIENPLTASGLGWAQRLCYFMAMFHFLFPLPRFVFMTAPLAYLLMGETIIAASPLAIVAYAGPHIIHSIVTASRIQGRVRHSFWSEIYEAVLSVYLLPVTLATLLDPRRGRFNVTDKGGTLADGYFDLRAVGPNMVLSLFLMAGLVSGIVGLLTNERQSLEFQAYALNLVWALLCLITVLTGLAVGRERRQLRERARISAEIPAIVLLPDGRAVEAETRDLSLGGAAVYADRPDGLPEDAVVTLELDCGGEVIALPAEVLRWSEGRLQVRFAPQDLRDEGQIVRAVLGRADAWVNWDDTRVDRPLRSLREVILSITGLVRGGSQFSLRRRSRANRQPPPPPPAPPPPERPAALSRTTRPGEGRREAPRRAAAWLLVGLGLGLAAPAAAQRASVPPAAPAPAVPSPAQSPAFGAPPAPAQAPAFGAAPAPAPAFGTPAPAAPAFAAPGAQDPTLGTRRVSYSLRQLGLRSPMQLRGTSDLQGVLFGVRSDEVVTQARLVLQGSTSPALIPELSQIAVSLNEQFVGAIQPDRNRPSFGPLDFPVNPVFFADNNRLNFRFSGRYAVECNDPLSGLLWAVVSDTSTLNLVLEKLPLTRDLARLPEPFFDPRLLRDPLELPVVLPEGAGNDAMRAAAIATSWFAVQADYRGASFPTGASPPLRGHGVVIATGADSVPGLALPRFDGPTVAVVPNPNDPFGLLLVLGGRTGAETVAAATAIAVGREALSGELALVQVPDVPARQPYDAPRWIRSDRPVKLGELVDPSELQVYGYSPGPISIPFRTAPDLFTWRNRPLEAEIRYRAPPGPIVDVAVSRIDATVNDLYLRSFPLRRAEPAWPLSTLARVFGGGDRSEGRVGIPPWIVFGQNEMQLRFDMKPLSRGDCVAVPGDIRAGIDPDSTIDLSAAHRFTTLPNLSYFASSGFPFTRLADLSTTTVVLPDRPSPVEVSAFLGLVGRISALVGYPATGIQVVRPQALGQAAERDLIVVGALGRQPALQQLMQNAPLQLDGNRLSVALPDALGPFRHVFGGGARRGEAERASAQLAAPGDALGAVFGFESPLKSGRSVLVVTGASPAGLEAMVAALRDPEQLPRIQGDLAILSGGRVQGYSLGHSYPVGTLPPWLWPQYYLSGSPSMLLLALAIAILLIASPLYWVLRRRAVHRLRMRTN